LEFYYDAFEELSTCRPQSYSLGLIPWTAINDFAKRYNLEREEFDEFSQIIRGLDSFLVKYMRDKEGNAT